MKRPPSAVHHPCTTFELKRTGTFHVRTHGPNHCGTTPELDIRYTVEVSCLSNELSSRGFMFDQVSVDKLFQATKVTSRSCEKLAAAAASRIRALIRAENKGLVPIRLRVTLSPAPYAAEVAYDYIDQDAAQAARA